MSYLSDVKTSPLQQYTELLCNTDIVGLPTTAVGYNGILTVTDKLSKRVHLIPSSIEWIGGAEAARLSFDNTWKLHGARTET